MSTTTSIFTFDHGQKKLNKAIGVEECFLDDLQSQMIDILRNHLFDENKEMRDDVSPSKLVEASLHEFSYNQLVVIASFFLQHKLDEFVEMMEQKAKKVKAQIKKIALDADDLPSEIRDFFEKLAEEGESGSAIDGESLPGPVKDFLKNLAERSDNEDKPDGDGDDD